MIKSNGQKFSGEIKFFAVFSIACFLGLCFHCKLELETERSFILHTLCVKELRVIFMLSGSQKKEKRKEKEKKQIGFHGEIPSSILIRNKVATNLG